MDIDANSRNTLYLFILDKVLLNKERSLFLYVALIQVINAGNNVGRFSVLFTVMHCKQIVSKTQVSVS